MLRSVAAAYDLAREQYAEIGVDADPAVREFWIEHGAACRRDPPRRPA